MLVNLYAQFKGCEGSSSYPIDAKLSRAHFHSFINQQITSQKEAIDFAKGNFENLNDSEVSLDLIYLNESKSGKHYTFSQKIKGVEVFRSEWKVNTDKVGKIRSVFDFTFSSNIVEVGNFPTMEFFLQSDEHSFALNNILESKKVWFYDGAHLIPSLSIKAMKGVETAETLVMNFEGKMVYRERGGSYAEKDSLVYGNIFLPDPLSTSGNIYGTPYSDQNDDDVLELNQEIVFDSVMATFDDVSGLFKLKNSYVEITEHSLPTEDPISIDSNKYTFTRAHQAFEEFNVFFHINAIKKQLNQYGYNLVNYPIWADVHGMSGGDNSQFVSWTSPPRLTFGDGGVDDAEDADVVVHEYTHAIVFSATGVDPSGTQRKAIDEAAGDFIASSYSRTQTSFDWYKVMTWDGHNEFWSGRFSNSTKHYPEDLANEFYADSEIISSVLMEIWGDLGRDTTEILFLEASYSFSTGMSMTNFAELMVDADKTLLGGRHLASLCNRFTTRGLLTVCDVGVDEKELSPQIKILNQESFSSGNSDLLVFSSVPILSFEVYSIDGKLVLNNSVNSTRFSISPETLSTKGVYLINIVTAIGSKSVKITRL